MSLPFGGIGGKNIDKVDAKNSGLDLFTRSEIDISLIHGNDVEVRSNYIGEDKAFAIN